MYGMRIRLVRGREPNANKKEGLECPRVEEESIGIFLMEADEVAEHPLCRPDRHRTMRLDRRLDTHRVGGIGVQTNLHALGEEVGGVDLRQLLHGDLLSL